MASSTLANFAVTPAWVNVVATLSSAASVPVIVQNIGTESMRIVWGGSSPAVTTAGHRLRPDDSFSGSAAAIWVRSEGYDGILAVTVL